jgi:hypothetical protein
MITKTIIMKKKFAIFCVFLFGSLLATHSIPPDVISTEEICGDDSCVGQLCLENPKYMCLWEYGEDRYHWPGIFEWEHPDIWNNL